MTVYIFHDLKSKHFQKERKKVNNCQRRNLNINSNGLAHLTIYSNMQNNSWKYI